MVDRDKQDWVEGAGMEYDALRYDPEDWKQDECLVCGTRIEGFADRGTAQAWCPECDVTVMLI